MDNAARVNLMRLRRVRRLLGLFVLLLTLALLFFAWRLYSVVREEKRSATLYQTLRVAGGAQTQTAPMLPTEPNPQSDDDEPLSQMDFDALLAANADTVGWLQCDGTAIDYPVMQADDNAYYLDRLFDKTENKAGSLFLDFRAAPDFHNDNSVIYGHHMRNGSMLAGITAYREQAYYDAHPCMRLYTPQGDYLIELFGGFVARDETVYTGTTFANAAAFEAFLHDVRAQSTFQSDVALAYGDRILSLVTCTYETQNARYVLLGKLTRMY